MGHADLGIVLGIDSCSGRIPPEVPKGPYYLQREESFPLCKVNE